MSVETTGTTVRRTVDVAAPIEHAFVVFTEQMISWWEPTHHLIENVVEMAVDRRAGGTITDVGADGSRCTWSRVLAYEPPRLFVFTWDISTRWELEPDPERCSEVHVSFEARTDRSTRVVMEHRHLERHGEGWVGMRDAVGGSGGWPLGLSRFAEAAERAEANGA